MKKKNEDMIKSMRKYVMGAIERHNVDESVLGMANVVLHYGGHNDTEMINAMHEYVMGAIERYDVDEAVVGMARTVLYCGKHIESSKSVDVTN